MNKAKLEHFGITVRDIDTSIDWYKTNFGFEEVKRFDKPALEIKATMIKLNDFLLELIQPYNPEKNGKEIKNGTPLKEILKQLELCHFAICVDDISAVYDKIEKSGVKYITELFDSRYFFCVDLDNVLIEVRHQT